MKKILNAILVAAALFVAVPSQAQGVSFGVKGGFNITDMKFSNSTAAMKQMAKDNKNGWYIGPTVKVSFLAGLGLDGAIFYDQRKTDLAVNSTGDAVKQQFIYVPINLRYSIGLGSIAAIYVAAGPQFGFNVGDSEISWNNALSDFGSQTIGQITGQAGTTTTTDAINNTFQLKKTTFGVNVGAGVTLLKHFEVGFTYCIPLGNTADLNSKYSGTLVSDIGQAWKDVTGDVKTHTWQLSAAFYF